MSTPPSRRGRAGPVTAPAGGGRRPGLAGAGRGLRRDAMASGSPSTTAPRLPATLRRRPRPRPAGDPSARHRRPGPPASDPAPPLPQQTANPGRPGHGGRVGPGPVGPVPHLTQGRYFLYTSGHPGPPGGQRAGGLGHQLRRRGARSPTPCPPSPPGRSPASPGPPTSTGSGPATSSTSPPWCGDPPRRMQCIGDATGTSPRRALHLGQHPVHLPGRPGRIHRPPGLHRCRRHHLDAVEVRPEHRRGHHADQDVVAAPVRQTAWA